MLEVFSKELIFERWKEFRSKSGGIFVLDLGLGEIVLIN